MRPLPLLSCIDAVEAAAEMSRVLSDQGNRDLLMRRFRSFGGAVSPSDTDLFEHLNGIHLVTRRIRLKESSFRLLFHERPLGVLTTYVARSRAHWT